MDERGGAWEKLQDALPPRWTVGLAAYDPSAHSWSVSAVGSHSGRGKMPRSVTGTGDDELSAVPDLDAELRGERIDRPPTSLEALRARLRLAYLEGAEEWSRQRLGRALTPDDLARVIRSFAGRKS